MRHCPPLANCSTEFMAPQCHLLPVGRRLRLLLVSANEACWKTMASPTSPAFRAAIWMQSNRPDRPSGFRLSLLAPQA